MDVRGLLKRINEGNKRGFDENQRIKSFYEYLDDLAQLPYLYTRGAAQYLRDMFDFYRAASVQGIGKKETRLLLFDLAFRKGKGRVLGQEEACLKIYKLIKGFSYMGQPDKLILLHGPNGSSKSTIVEAIFQGMEYYSHQPEGILFRFNWIFPKGVAYERRLGFDSIKTLTVKEKEFYGEIPTFAYLDHEHIQARLNCELKDNPFFLIPKGERKAFLEEIINLLPPEERKPEFSLNFALEGDLCQKCKTIYENLFSSYHGDWLNVLSHIQIERVYVSRRYRVGAVTIEPQANIDAGAQQVSSDSSLAYLPPVLQNIRLFEPMGDLVDANIGAIEYSDFLKRPIDANKYLLTTSEKGTISLPNFFAHLNLVFLGTTNENHLDAFKQHQDFNAFKGRIELVTVPYLLKYSQEQEIFNELIDSISKRKHVAPHTTFVASLWAVLTRLLKPDGSRYPESVRGIISKLSPLDKAKLYDSNTPPAPLDPSEVKLILSFLPSIRDEFKGSVYYEGRFGASPREIKIILSDASYNMKYQCLTPFAVFEELRDFVKDRSVYEFLKLEPNDGYNDNVRFIDTVESEYLQIVTKEMYDAMDLVEEEEYDRRFDRYFEHVIAFNKGEKVKNPRTGVYEEPSREILESIESLLNFKETVGVFRKNLVGKIGAFYIDNPGKKVNFRKLFPEILRALKEKFYSDRKEKIETIENNLLKYGTEDFKGLSIERQREVVSTIQNMVSRYNYCEVCSKEVILQVIRRSNQKSQGG